MKRLLRIDTSTREENSHSRDLANSFEEKYKVKYVQAEVKYRNLGTSNIPHVSQAFIDAMFTPNESRTKEMHETLTLSNELITEFKNADTILLSVPMFNFSIPSVLKAYIDHITRVGETFSMDETGFQGLVTGKKLVIVAAYGAEFSEMKAMDFVEPYLKSIFGFLGFTNISYFAVEGTSMLSEEVLEERKLLIKEGFASNI
ncbi:MAG TPA: FMN-dependent NADH-azoreductase [Arcobacter sp.]|nr:FMN-dependent NADH-azoreductase [Arcobacter sp.]